MSDTNQPVKDLWPHLCPISRNREYTRSDKCYYCGKKRPEDSVKTLNPVK